MPSSLALHLSFRVHLAAGRCQKTASRLPESNANTERTHLCLHRQNRTLSHDIQNVWRTPASPHDRLLGRSNILSRRYHLGKQRLASHRRALFIRSTLWSPSPFQTISILPRECPQMSPSEADASPVLPLVTRRISSVYPTKCLRPSLLSVGGMKPLWGRVP